MWCISRSYIVPYVPNKNCIPRMFFIGPMFFNSILLFAHVQLNAVVVGIAYVLSCKTDYRNSKGEPTRFSLFHFQQNGCSSGGMTLESEGYDSHFVAVCKHRNYQADDEHPQFHELVLKEESQFLSRIFPKPTCRFGKYKLLQLVNRRSRRD